MAKNRKDTPGPWMRPAAAARLLGCAKSTVTYRIGAGRYRSKLVGDVVYVSREDVERDAAAQAA